MRNARARGTAARAASTAFGEQHARSESGPFGSSQRRSVTPTAAAPDAQQRHGAVDSAAHRNRDARRRRDVARTSGPIAFASASTGSVSPPTAAASSSVSPRRSSSRPGRPHRRSRRLRPEGARPPSRRRAPNRRRARAFGQGSPLSRRRGEPSSPRRSAPTPPTVPRPCEPGQARWVPCGASARSTYPRRGLPFTWCWFYMDTRRCERRRALLAQ